MVTWLHIGNLSKVGMVPVACCAVISRLREKAGVCASALKVQTTIMPRVIFNQNTFIFSDLE